MCRPASGKPPCGPSSDPMINLIACAYSISSNPDILLDRKIKEKKCKDDAKDSLDFSDIDKSSRDSLVNDLIGLVPEPSIQPLPVLCDFDIVPIENAANASFVPVPESDSSTSIELYGSDNEISVCIVCEKRFKSPACMNKHLKSVHTGESSPRPIRT